MNNRPNIIGFSDVNFIIMKKDTTVRKPKMIHHTMRNGVFPFYIVVTGTQKI